MTDGPSDSVEVYRARGLPEAHAIRALLEECGIPSRIENELLPGGSEQPVGGATASRVVVDAGHEAEARAVVEGFLRRADEPEEDDGPLHCLACGARMGEAEACVACGWSYGGGWDAALEVAGAPAPTTEGEPGRGETGPIGLRLSSEGGPEGGPGVTSGALWCEVAAVLAVGVVPSLAAALTYLHHPTPPLPYWLDALYMTILSGCTVFVTLYLIHRSGEPWAQFGVTRLVPMDVLVGAVLLVATEALWLLQRDLYPAGDPSGADLFPAPRRPADYALMVLMHGANGFAEELVTRGYLITRLVSLLRSRTAAVLLSAAVFASYHVYQGAPRLVDIWLYGVMYGAAYLLVRRVWPLAIGHALYNIRVELLL